MRADFRVDEPGSVTHSTVQQLDQFSGYVWTLGCVGV
jgi:hypothetical protein